MKAFLRGCLFGAGFFAVAYGVAMGIVALSKLPPAYSVSAIGIACVLIAAIASWGKNR